MVKLGAEMTAPDNKDGRDFVQLLLERRKSLVQEEWLAFRGKSWLKWSPGLRARYGLSEGLSDAAIADGLGVGWSRRIDMRAQAPALEFFFRACLADPRLHDLWDRSFRTLDFRALYDEYARFCTTMPGHVEILKDGTRTRVPGFSESDLRGNPFDVLLPPRQPAPC